MVIIFSTTYRISYGYNRNMKLVTSRYRRQGVLNFLSIFSVKDLCFAAIRIKSILASFHKGFFASLVVLGKPVFSIQTQAVKLHKHFFSLQA